MSIDPSLDAGPDAVGRTLERSRQELLDLGLRNSLISYRPLRARGAEVVDEMPVEVFRLLVRESRRMSFDPISDPSETTSLPQPEGEDPAVPAARHLDHRLQTAYTSSQLQSRLLSTYYAARTFIEEQGVNVLFLALGMLEWFESDSSQEPRRAPMVLVPVELERSNALDRFHLIYTAEDIGDNLSIAAKVRFEFGVELPNMPETEDLDVDTYFEAVERAIAGNQRWRVDRSAVALGFFSFGKFLMYRDLDPAVWPEESNPANHPIIQSLLGDGFREPASSIGDDDFLDTHLDEKEIYQVVDADSSQTLTIVDAMNGRNMVVQGPPGTGKSQTITNIIAEAIGAGKTVLFVAEKMAALEVVKRRLDQVGLGDACLELHSNKINKRSVVMEIQRTLDLGRPRLGRLETELSTLADYRSRLNEYCDAINTPVLESGLTPYTIYGELVQIRQQDGEDNWPRVDIDGIAGWNSNEYSGREAIISELQSRVAATGLPSQHPFWGVGKSLILPTEEPRLRTAALETMQGLHAVGERASSSAREMNVPFSADLAFVDTLIGLLKRAAEAPLAPGVDVANDLWVRESDRVETLVQSGRRRAEIVERNQERLKPEVWDRDLDELRSRLADARGKWWRSLSGGYRSARSELSEYCTGGLPGAVDEQLALVDDVIEAQRLAAVIDQHRETGIRLFGPHWRGIGSDWEELEIWSKWFVELHRDVQTGRLPSGIISYLQDNTNRAGSSTVAADLEQARQQYVQALQTLQQLLEFDPQRLFGVGASIEEQSFAVQYEILNAWTSKPEAINDIVALNVLADICLQNGLTRVYDLAVNWPGAGKDLATAFRRARMEALPDSALLQRPALSRFDGEAHQQVVCRFRELDILTFEYNRARLAHSHWTRIPRADGGGQIGVLRREFEKKSRHLPVRRLIERAGNAIQAIKPVFMMSPLSIATYVSPATMTFDMVVFDEASQVKPVEAFGALLRSRQAVVVGDSRQLPPTSFFDSLTHTDDDADEEDVTSDIESILGLFAASNAPQRMLRWHYRSRHESLITVSNYEFYDNRLVLFPSPDASKESSGLIHRLFPDTVYVSAGAARNAPGGSSRTGATNPDEARIVAQSVMEHARSSPELTLGVAAFSQAQAEAIRDQVELLRRQDPGCETFFSSHPYEPFFVKNLENVQGDERDVIFISIGYGRDEHGRVAMRFGPLNNNGGERRLNVLITRARQRCEVFTNLTADDIRVTDASPRGLVAFKRFLRYAQTGDLDIPRESGGDFDSPFEVAVYDALVQMGYTVDKQVGSAGFFIDMAIIDPRHPGRYLLAVECDGATYHSARSARDRDRLRQSVLENLGWQVHRIWSTDWFRNPRREMERLAAVVEEAVAREPDAALPLQQVIETSIDRDDDLEHEIEPGAVLYEIADLVVTNRDRDLHLVPVSRLAEWTVIVVATESPVHSTEVARRIADAYGVARIGRRIREAIDTAIAAAADRNQIVVQRDFLWKPEMVVPPLRDRIQLPNTSRSIDLIAPQEVDEAVLHVVENAYGIDVPDVAPAVCRMFGFQRATEGMQSVIHAHIEHLVGSGKLIQQGMHLTLGQAGKGG